MTCSCGRHMFSTGHLEYTISFCPGRGCPEVITCNKCNLPMNKDKTGIYACSCGVRETYCKNPIFSFNGVYDGDCGRCPKDHK